MCGLQMKEGTKIVDHLNVFNTLMCQFTSIGVKIEEEDKADMLFCTLPKTWDHLVTTISYSAVESLEFNSFVGALMSLETRRNFNSKTSTLEAFVARG